MLRKIYMFLNLFMGGCVGLLIGRAVHKYLDYKNHPGLYAMTSAPWYTEIIVMGIVVAIVLIACVIAKILIKRKLKTQI